ncbi:hypothetical protein HYS47_05710 [Candidatus Woesearchaeota archaeon]|nr:hypothetical protein [Candidatus Woesearchaeota archaeon]
MNKHLFLFFVLCTILLSCKATLSEEHDTVEQQLSFDPKTFDYENGDYSLITDWTIVNWNQIPPSRVKEVPVDKLVYEQLDSAQRIELTPEQIARNFDNIESLTTDVHWQKAEEAIHQKFGVTVSIKYASPDIFIRDNVILIGGETPLAHATLTDSVYTLGEIVVAGRDITFVPAKDKGVHSINLPDGDSLSLDAREDTYLINDNTFTGSMHYDKGRWYIWPGDKPIIDGISLSTTYSETYDLSFSGDQHLPVYFDGLPHESSFLSMNGQTKQLSYQLKKGTATVGRIEFLQGNPFVDVKPDDSFSLDGSRISTIMIQEQRDGIVPKLVVGVIMQENKDESTGEILQNGKTRLVAEKTGVSFSLLPNGEQKGSVPLAMLLKDDKGNPLFTTTEATQKLIFDNSNNFIILPETVPEEFIECISCAEDYSQSVALYDYASYELLSSKGIQKFISTAGKDPIALARFMYLFKKLPPNIQNSVQGIELLPQDEVNNRCIGSGITIDTGTEIVAGGCIKDFVVVTTPDVSFQTLYHETAHTLTIQTSINWQTTDQEYEQAIKEYLLWLKNKYQIDHLSYNWIKDNKVVRSEGRYLPVNQCKQKQECIHMYDNYNREIILPTEDSFELLQLLNAKKEVPRSIGYRWLDVAGDEYLPPGYMIVTTGREPPENGFVRKYGSSNYLEDISTFVEPIAKEDHEFFKRNKLIQPPGHPDYDPAKYDQRYKQKLDLLLEYGFITKEDYDKIFEGVT